MSYIIILSILVLLWPMAAVITMGPKRVLPYIIGVFLSFFLCMNTVHSFIANVATTTALLSILSIAATVPMIYFGYKEKCWKLGNIKKSFNWLWTLYLIIAIAAISRLVINHLNSDTISYAIASQQVKMGTFAADNDSFWYKTPIFYQLAALAPISVNFFSIFGEVLQLTIFVIILNSILREKKDRSKLVLLVSSILIALATIYAITYKTSSVNWSVGVITMVGFIALRKDMKSMILLPFAMSVFSFTAMLMAPAALMFALWRKKWTLKEMVMIIVSSVVILAFMGLNLLNIPYKMFILVWGLALVMALGMWGPKIPDKTINNFIYKFKPKKINAFTEKENYRLYVFIFAFFAFIFVETIMILMYTDVLGFPLIITPKVMALMTTIPFASIVLIADTFMRKKASPFFKWLMIVAALMIVYAAAQQIPGVLDYMLDRVSLPYASCITLVALMRMLERDFMIPFKDKFRYTNVMTIGVLMVSSAGLMAGDFVPSILWSRLSFNIEENYVFVTGSEISAVNSQLTSNDVIYSDVAISTMPEVWDKHAYYTNSDRDPFFSEMHDRVSGIPSSYYEEFIRYTRLQIKHKIWKLSPAELKKLPKKVVKDFEDERDKLTKKGDLHWKVWRYSTLADTIDVLQSDQAWWKEWDSIVVNDKTNKKRITKFMFRRKVYADIVSKHYNKAIVNVNGMYMVSLK